MRKEFIRGIFWITLYYIVLGTTYWLVLYTTYGDFKRLDTGEQALIAFSIRCLLSIIVYWILFIRLRHLKLWIRIALHLVTMPLYLWLAFTGLHIVSDYLGVLYLGGRYANWDIYIPLVLYVGLFALLHSYAYFVLLKNEKIRMASLRIQVLQANLNILKNRIQPHFLYNSLNSINAMLGDDQKEIEQAIGRLADVFRIILNSSDREWIAVKDELTFLRKYLSIEQLRFKHKLNVRFQVSELVADYAVPAMLIQPLVENAVVHGLVPSSAPVNISIGIALVKDKITCRICDDGMGSPIEPKERLLRQGTGLRNVHQRLLLYFKTGLTIKNNTPSGLCVSFSIPAVKYESLDET